jgi:PTH1 family peptidyl-tRNA hydrolase
MDTINYVLGVPPGDERILLATGEEKAVESIPLIIEQDVGTAMNIINADPEAQRKAEEKRRRQQERRELRRQEKEQQALLETESASD